MVNQKTQKVWNVVFCFGRCCAGFGSCAQARDAIAAAAAQIKLCALAAVLAALAAAAALSWRESTAGAGAAQPRTAKSESACALTPNKGARC